MVRLISHLTERDRRIALDCYEHRVLTTEQLRRLHFAGRRTASARLGELFTLRVLDRFRPAWRHGEGSTPYHWVLDEAGARIVAADLGIERAELRWRHDAALGVASSAKLAHQVAANDFFTALAEQARAAGGALTEWYGDRTTHDLLAGVVVPDGYGVLELPRQPPTHLLLELDRGTETHDRLLDKARGYAKALPREPAARSRCNRPAGGAERSSRENRCTSARPNRATHSDDDVDTGMRPLDARASCSRAVIRPIR